MGTRSLLAWVLMVGSVLAVTIGVAAEKPAIDGTTWDVTVMPDEDAEAKGEQEFDDTIVFEAGKVYMTECVKVGFAASTYTIDRSEEGWRFRTKQTSDTEGTAVWEATIDGDSIEGTLVWTKTDGTVLRYDFDGIRVDEYDEEYE